MGVICYSESLALHGLASSYGYDAPSAGNTLMKNPGFTIIAIAITRRRPDSISVLTPLDCRVE
ncbi:hypothetical protein HZS38_02250 [Xenorhabdus nematophila]|nr:hypothetical protein [Xenorhabdus nematophila]MCB4426977.1 hypothetical protein [Xenorhabdus nematophila]QNJ37153.1 hypothetical protein H8F46_02555 [Xenorhabdus nematophila]